MSGQVVPFWGPTDKEDHGLLKVYDELFATFDVRGSLLEIGVKRGGGLNWFMGTGRFSPVVGLDIDHSAKAPDGAGLRIGDQADEDVLNQLAADYGGFDVVVDDGSHFPDHVATSFSVLWPHCRRLYVIEDWGVMYTGCERKQWLGVLSRLIDGRERLGYSELVISTSRFPDRCRDYVAVVR